LVINLQVSSAILHWEFLDELSSCWLFWETLPCRFN